MIKYVKKIIDGKEVLVTVKLNEDAATDKEVKIK